MTPHTVITREQFLAMTPDVYLADGFRDDKGALRDDLTSLWATASAVQLESVSSRELTTMVMSFGQVLPLHTGKPADRYADAWREAVQVAAGVLRAVPSDALLNWIDQSAGAIATEQDLLDFMTHAQAVVRQHASFAAMRAQGNA